MPKSTWPIYWGIYSTFLVPEATEREDKDLQRGLTDENRQIFYASLMQMTLGLHCSEARCADTLT
jgi:hypothetical protein